MIKKLQLMLFSLLIGGSAAQAQYYEALAKTGWTITASSDCVDTAPSGPIAYAIDGDVNTYWHSNWRSSGGNGDNSKTLPQWFVIDMKEVKDFDAVRYLPRQSSGAAVNGTCTEFKLFVSETPFDDELMTWNTVGADARTRVTNNQVGTNHAEMLPVASGNLPADNLSAYRIIRSNDNNKMSGRYILFVYLASGGQESNKYASCGEFDVINEIHPFVPQTGQAYTLKTKDSGLYLNLTKDTQNRAVLSSEATPVYFSAEAGSFRLAISPESYTGTNFLNISAWNSNVSSADSRTYWTFTPVGDEANRAWRLSQDDASFGGSLGNNSHSQEGKELYVNVSSDDEIIDWVIEEYTPAEPKYYVIDSYNRGGSLTSLSLLSALQHVTATTGSQWMIETQAGGGVKLYNMFNNKYLDFDSKKLTDEGSVFYILQHDVQMPVNGFALSKTATITNGSCIDANNSNSGVGNWQTSASDWNGTTWMIREVPATEIVTVFDNYLDNLAIAGDNGLGYSRDAVDAAIEKVNAFGSEQAGWKNDVVPALATLEQGASWPVYAIENCSPAYGVGKTIIDDANGGQPHFKVANTIDDRMLWVIKTNEKTMSVGEYAMHNFSTGMPLRGVAQINVTETTGDQVEGQFLMKLGNDVQHAQNVNSVVVTWNSTTGANTASAWKFNYVGTTAELAAYSEIYAQGRALRDAVTAAENYAGRIGTALGQYGDMTQADYNAQVAAIRTQKLDGKTPDTYVDVTDDVATLTGLAQLPINLPKAGQLLRIRSARSNFTDYYLGSENSTKNTGRTAFVNGISGANELATIFYLTEDNKLVNLATGYRLNEASNFVNYANITAGTTFTFAAATTNAVGKYNIKFNNGNRSLYTQNASETVEGEQVVYVFTDAAGGNTPAQEGYVFTLENVNAVPVSISAAGWATLYAPVSLNVPSEVEAYTVEVNEANTVATLNAVHEIPAGTGVVLKGVEGTYNFTVSNASAAKEGVLEGDVATAEYTQNSIYILAKPAADKVGFYKMTSANDRIVKGCKAYLPAVSTAGAPAYLFSFGDLTGIGSVETSGSAEGAAYDLSGRRVATPQKGLYIVGGKKVLVK